MKRVILMCVAVFALVPAGCSNYPSRKEFLALEAECLEAYCSSDAPAAREALLACVRYADRCQAAGVPDIQYREVLARAYGRLYLVERRLGHNAAAEECLRQYARYHAARSTLARQTGRPYGEMERLIEDKYDRGLRVAWKNQ